MTNDKIWFYMIFPCDSQILYPMTNRGLYPGLAGPCHPGGPFGHVTQVRSDVDEKDPVLMSKRFREKLLRSKGTKAYLAVEV